MKNIILYSDGTYKKKKHLTGQEDLFLLPIGTDLKGPVFTLVKTPINIIDNIITITLNYIYQITEIPIDNDSTFVLDFHIQTINELYNIYPLIMQMIHFNTFLCNESCDWYNNSWIVIQLIRFQMNELIIDLYEENSDNDIRKIFKEYNILPYTKSFLTQGDTILLINGRWGICNIEISELVRYSFDYILIPLLEEESLYLLSYDDFIIFSQIQYGEIEIQYYENDEDCFRIIKFSDIYSILRACLYVPQLIMMESKSFNIEHFISLKIELPYKHISYKEKVDMNMNKSPTLFNLFDLIRRLLILKP